MGRAVTGGQDMQIMAVGVEGLGIVVAGAGEGRITVDGEEVRIMVTGAEDTTVVGVEVGGTQITMEVITTLIAAPATV
jgi:hypothetical protein